MFENFDKFLAGKPIPGLVLFLLIGRLLLAQSNLRVMGHVRNAEDGAPLVGASVYLQGTGFGASTDEDGSFRLENVPPGDYTLVVALLGFQPRRVTHLQIREDQVTRVEIQLHPAPLSGDSVLVTAPVPDDALTATGEKIILGPQELKRYRALGLSRLLQQVAGLQVESEGSDGSRVRITIHGSRASQVLVLLDGQRLNNPQTGAVDLSLLSLDQIARVEIVRQGNAALYGSNAYAGVISFHSRDWVKQNESRVRAAAGSFNTYRGGLALERQLRGTGIFLNYSQNYSRQNFPYQYEGQTKIRQNAWYRHRKLFGKLTRGGKHFRTSLLYQGKWGERGIPSSFFDEQLPFAARLEEAFHTVQMRQRWFVSSHQLLEAQIGYHWLKQLYENTKVPAPYLKNRYRTKQTNAALEARLENRWQLHRRLDTRLGVSYLHEMLDQQNLLYPPASIGKKIREIESLFGSLDWKLPLPAGWFSSGRFHAALRLEKIFQHPWRGFPYAGINLVPKLLQELSLSFSWTRGVRYPDFNSLFWKGDARAQGNPNLQPEESTAWNTGLRYQPEKTWLPRLSLLYYQERIENLIFWFRRFDGVWEPRNEERFEKTGLDIMLQQNLWPEHLRLNLAYSWVQARNKKNDPILYDKRLVFVPEHSLNTSLWFGGDAWQAQVVARYVSERETVLANSRGTQLKPYFVWDASVHHTIRWRRVELEMGLVGKNLTGEDYQLILGYPMPGREFGVNISVKLFNP